MGQRARDTDDGGVVALVNPDADTSVEAVAAWVAELEADDDWVELGVSAADLIDEARAASALHRVLRLPASVARSAPLLSEAWRYRNHLIVHDAVYVVLAEHLGAPLLTGDRKMASASNLPVSVLHLSAAP